MYRDGKLEESLLKRRAAKALAARQSNLTALGKFLKSVMERALHLDEDVEINDARVVYPNNCFVLEVQHHHGSQLLAAVIQPTWVQQTVGELSSSDIVFLHFAKSVHALVGVAGIESEGSCSIACATSPMMFHRDRSFRNGRSCQNRNSLHGPALFSTGSRSSCPAFRLSVLTRFRTRHNGAQTRSVTPLSPMSAPKQIRYTCATCRCVVDQAFTDPAVHKRMTGKCMLGVFGGSGFVAKATNSFGIVWICARHKIWPRYVVTQPLPLTRIRQDVSAGKCVGGMISLPRQHTPRALPKLSPPLLPLRTCFIVPACRGLWKTRVIRGCGSAEDPEFCGTASHGLGPVRFWCFGSPC